MLNCDMKSTRGSAGAAKWFCKCDCGNTHSVLGYVLIMGKTKSCGCMRYSNSGHRLRPYEASYHNLRDHKNRGYKVELTYEEFVKFSNTKTCHYCCAKVGWMPYGDQTYHLDRVDNSGPYSVNNCVVCCKRCNYGKGRHFTYAEWMAITEIFRRGLWERIVKKYLKPPRLI